MKNLNLKINNIILVNIIFIFFNCEVKREALGADNEIRVICSDLDKDIVKKYLSEIFSDTIFTPEPEPYYYLKFSDPSSYNAIRSQAYIIIAYANETEGNTGYQLVQKLLPKDQLDEIKYISPMILDKDIFSKNQLFMILNLSSENVTNKFINDKKKLIRKKFHEQFILRQSKHLFSDVRNKNLEKKLFLKYGVSLKIPWGWDLIKEHSDSNFFWLGKEMPFQWIGLSWESGKLVDNEIEVGNYMWSWPSKYYGYIQNSNYKFKMDKMTFNNNYAWRLKGVWETIDFKESKGGPFNSYLYYDENIDKTVHMNYLVHYPGKDKSIFMRQMDLIVKTFKLN